MICKLCKGCGTVWHQNVLIDCPPCLGTGEDFLDTIPAYRKPSG